MMHDFDILSKHINKCEIRLSKYNLTDLFHAKPFEPRADDYEKSKFPFLQDVPNFTQPQACTWKFTNESETEQITQSKNYEEIRNLISEKFCQNYPKGAPRTITIDLLYSCTKFAKSSNFTNKQTSTLLSIFYLTHRFFSVSYTATAEDVFNFFKEILTFHSLQYVPNYWKIFEVEEAHAVFNYFCKIYLRHLPIIRLLSLPNFGLKLDITVPPFPKFKKFKPEKKGKKGKKGKKEKKGKKKR